MKEVFAVNKVFLENFKALGEYANENHYRAVLAEDATMVTLLETDFSKASEIKALEAEIQKKYTEKNITPAFAFTDPTKQASSMKEAFRALEKT
jgi:hypothetical protein